MTIRFRNRLNLFLILLSLLFFAFDIGSFVYLTLTGNFTTPEVYIDKLKSPYSFTNYHPYYVIFSIYYLMFYVFVTSIVILTSFEKTQATEIIFFLIFLFSLLFDSFRILIPYFHISFSYSKLLMVIGNSTLFSRILAPFSLLCMTILVDESMRQDLERNCVIIIIIAAFFAIAIPLNTSIILPNFMVSHGFSKILGLTDLIMSLAAIFTLAIQNIRNDYNQVTTIGLFLLILGYNILFVSYDIFHVIMGVLTLTVGTIMFAKQLHNQYLWNY